jgi:hypothetical protein
VARPFHPPDWFIKISLTMNSKYEAPYCGYVIIFYTKAILEGELPSAFFSDVSHICGYGLHT